MEKIIKTQGDERVQVYEVGFHIVPIVSTEALPVEVNAIRSLIESTGGAIISEGTATMKNLAYTLSKMRGGKREKYDSAFFDWIKFETTPSAVSIIKDGIDKNENIIRYLIIKTVRENTLIEAVKPQAAAEVADIAPASIIKIDAKGPVLSGDEMDKTIDELVAE